ncbi:MAG: hypothetical protein ACKO85_01510 [Isosphaeraceae bacterium]
MPGTLGGERVVKSIVSKIMLCLVIFLSGQSLFACPNCKDGIAHYDATYGRAGYSANGLQKGFNYSVILMLGVPLSMVGTGGYFLRKLAREGRLPEF